ncbi:MAG: metal ABC transporter permease [Candidatus Thorarchaeota archaeon]
MIIDIINLILSSPVLQRALLAATLVALVAATSGTFMVFRGLSFLTSGVAHAALGGAALGLFFQATGIAPWFDPILGAVLFAVLVALLTAYAGERGIAQRMEVAIGVSFALSMSLAVFLMYYLPPTMIPQIWGYLIGDILLLDNLDIVLLIGTALSLVILVTLFKKEFVYVSIDMEGSTAHGMNARGYHYLLLIFTAIAIALTTKAVGAILVYAILVAPAAASSELLKTVNRIIIGVFAIALISMLIGLAGSFTILASPSAIAGLLAALSYIIAIQVKQFRLKKNEKKKKSPI